VFHDRSCQDLLDGLERSSLRGDALLQSLPVQLQIPMHDLRILR
jgi:hypothetical protein